MPEREIGAIGKARLETLADGVFAIVLTLLVLALLDPALARVTTRLFGGAAGRAPAVSDR
jgi:uncharacterized membrane protein